MCYPPSLPIVSSPFVSARAFSLLRICPLCLCLLAVLQAQNAARAGDIYVAPTGLTTNPGTNAQPTTIQRGVSIAVAGDTVWVKPGTYVITSGTQTVKPVNSGSAAAPITIRAVTSGTAVIDGQWKVPDPASSRYPQTAWRGLIEIVDRRWIVVDGLKVINSGFYGALITSLTGTSSNITIRNCIFYNTYGSGICARNSAGINIFGNVVQRVSQYPARDPVIGSKSVWIGAGECISFLNVNGFEIAHNTVCDRVHIALDPADPNYTKGLSPQGMPASGNGGEGIDAKAGCKNGSVHDNEVYDVTRVGIYVDSYAPLSENMEIHRNLVHDVDNGFAIASEGAINNSVYPNVAPGIVQNIRIHDNVVRDCLKLGFSISSAGDNGPRKDVSIYNNTAYYNGWGSGGYTATGIWVYDTNPANSNLVVRNNILDRNKYQIMGIGMSHLTVDRNLITANTNGWYQDNLPVMTNTVTTDDPLFLDEDNNDFRLKSGSPAINAALGTPLSVIDMALTARPQQGVVDLGAYEFTGSALQTGLKGYYHSTSSSTSPVVYTRTEAVALGLGDRPPAPGTTAGNFYVYWYGFITPKNTGAYSFRVRTSNGIKRSRDNLLSQNAANLWVNNQLMITTWYNNSNANVSAPVTLNAGQRYPIAIEFRTAAGNASMFLDWQTPIQPAFVVVPKEHLSPN